MNGSNGPTGCGPVTALLPELALGIVGGTERADVLAHLDHCPVCRDATTGFAATVDVLPTLLADAEPPAGFESRTLDRLAAERDRVPRRSRLQRVMAVAALVAAVMIVSVAAVRIIDARSDPDPETTFSSAAMIGHGTNDAGSAIMTSGKGRYLWLDIDYGDRSGTYRVETMDARDRVRVAGSVAVETGHAAWVGEIEGPEPAMVRLVGEDGRVWCTARFET